MRSAKDYSYYGINRKRFKIILNAMLDLQDEELISLGYMADWAVGCYLAKSIRDNISFEKIEARYGTLPTSKSDFYRKRRLMFHIMDVKLKENDNDN